MDATSRCLLALLLGSWLAYGALNFRAFRPVPAAGEPVTAAGEPVAVGESVPVPSARAGLAGGIFDLIARLVQQPFEHAPRAPSQAVRSEPVDTSTFTIQIDEWSPVPGPLLLGRSAGASRCPNGIPPASPMLLKVGVGGGAGAPAVWPRERRFEAKGRRS